MLSKSRWRQSQQVGLLLICLHHLSVIIFATASSAALFGQGNNTSCTRKERNHLTTMNEDRRAIQPTTMELKQLEQLASTLQDSRSDRLKYGLTFVVTGASSGIGLEACKLLAIMNPTNRIVLVARNQEKAEIAKDTVIESVWPNFEERQKYSMNVIPMECDHCSLSSVRAFSEELRCRLDESYHPDKWASNGIDALCLNAAVLQSNDSKAVFTDDGFETTFQTNHLAPFLIANLVTEMMNPAGRVVFSTSGLHLWQKLAFDGAIDQTTGALRKGFEMMDGSEFHYKRSYSLAKLCNVAVCVELNRRLRRRNVIATCFSPGLMTKSGLFRNQPRCGSSIATVPSNKEILMREKTVQWGAGSLVYMAVADATGKHGAQYWRDAESYAGSEAVYGKEFCPILISDEYISEKQRDTLWILSCQLTGISCDR